MDDFENSVVGINWQVTSANYNPNQWCIDYSLYSVQGRSAYVCHFADYAYYPGYTSSSDHSQVLFKSVDAHNYSNLTLQFDWKCNGESDKDYGSLFYSFNQYDWIPLISEMRSGDPLKTTNELIQLPKCLYGSTFYLGFTFTADESFNFQPGLVIDNFIVHGSYCQNLPNAAYNPSQPVVCEDHFNKINVSATPGSGANSLRWYETNASCQLKIGEGTFFSVLPDKSKNLYVTSYNTSTGCESTSFTTVPITIRPNPNIGLDGIVATSIGGDGAIEITASGGNAPYQYYWSGPLYTNTTADIYNLETGNYAVTVTDYYGCDSSAVFYIEEGSDLIIPNGISPNNDGKNDVWIIEGIHQWEDFELFVFNELNELMYEQIGEKKNGNYTPWDGFSTIKNKQLEDGQYFYKIHSKVKKRNYQGVLIIKTN